VRLAALADAALDAGVQAEYGFHRYAAHRVKVEAGEGEIGLRGSRRAW